MVKSLCYCLIDCTQYIYQITWRALSLLILPTAACGHQTALDVIWRFNPLCWFMLSSPIHKVVLIFPIHLQYLQYLHHPQSLNQNTFKNCSKSQVAQEFTHQMYVSRSYPRKLTQHWKSFKSQWEMHLHSAMWSYTVGTCAEYGNVYYYLYIYIYTYITIRIRYVYHQHASHPQSHKWQIIFFKWSTSTA